MTPEDIVNRLKSDYEKGTKIFISFFFTFFIHLFRAHNHQIDFAGTEENILGSEEQHPKVPGYSSL